ncbi:MAG: acyltransferase [Pseudomonadota bacterium]
MNIRSYIKRTVKFLFLLLTLPLYALYRIFSLAGHPDGVFQSFSQFLSLLPGKTGVYARAAFYHLACPETSDDISIGFLTVLSHRNTSIASGVYIGPQCNIGMCRIGENTLIGSGVHVLSGSRQHEFSDIERPIKDQGGRFEKIAIGNDCWIGNTAIVMVNIERKVIIAAGSVVVKEPESSCVIAGNPAKKIKMRPESSQQESPQYN